MILSVVFMILIYLLYSQEERDPLPTLNVIGRSDSGAKETDNISKSLSPTSKTGPPVSPTTPTFARKDKIDRSERAFKGISRRLSKRGR